MAGVAFMLLIISCGSGGGRAISCLLQIRKGPRLSELNYSWEEAQIQFSGRRESRLQAIRLLQTLSRDEMVGMLHIVGSTANVERMPHVTVLTGFRGDARDSPPDFLDQFFSNRWPKPRVIR